MADDIENVKEKFWQRRSKHGRDKLFATPQLMWEAACEYFEWCSDNPWIKKDWVGKDADEVERPTARPFTLTGLCLYLDCSSGYFRTFKLTATEDYLAVITRIEETIYTQQYEGAAVGAYNGNIIARSLGLKEQIDATSDGKAFNEIDYTKLPTDVLQALIDAKK